MMTFFLQYTDLEPKVEVKPIAFLTTISTKSLKEFLLPFFETLRLVKLETFMSEGGTLSGGNIVVVSIYRKQKTLPGHSRL